LELVCRKVRAVLRRCIRWRRRSDSARSRGPTTMASMSNDSVPRVAKLDVHNYLQWSTELEHIMRFKGCWPAVDPAALATPTPPSPGVGAGGTVSPLAPDLAAASEMQQAKDDRAEQQAVSLIMLNVKPQHYVLVRAAGTARAAWAALAEAFRSSDRARVMNLRTEGNTIYMAPKETAVEYFNRGRALVWELGMLGVKLEEEHLLSALLSGLEPKFEYNKEILANMDDLTLDKALVKLRAAETRMTAGKQRRATPAKTALAATGADASDRVKPRKPADTKRVERRRCFQCNKVGHLLADCPDGDAKPRNRGGVSMIASAGVALHGSQSPEDQEVAAVGALPDGWVVDSGASHHMTGGEEAMTRLGPCDPVKITLANGKVHTATKSGTVEFDALVEGDTVRMTLEDVLAVPGLAVSLLSVATVVDRGFEVTFHKSGVHIAKAGRIVAEGAYHGDVCVVSVPEGAATATGRAHAAVTARTWHRRFAHAGPDTLARVPQAVTGMKATPAFLRRQGGVSCAPCMRGKMSRLSFPVSTTRTTRPLELVHTDVCGPMDVKTPGKDRFQVVVIDDYSRYRVVVPVASKGLAKNVVMATLNQWETELGAKVKTIRRDGGDEYAGASMREWLEAKGIQTQRSVRYSPEQNGVAERYNGVLQERVLASLADSNLDKKWWAEAGKAVNYVNNRIPSRGQHKTPYELFHGKAPDVGNLRVFGCRVWVHVPSATRKKMGDKGVPGTFMGYADGSKAYRVLVGGRIVISRDVRFDEDVGGDGDAGPHGVEPAGVASIDDAVAAARRVTGTPQLDEEGVVSSGSESGSTSGTSTHDGVRGSGSRGTESPMGGGDPCTGPRRSTRRRQGGGRPLWDEDGGFIGGVGTSLAAMPQDPDKMRIHQARKAADWTEFDKAVKREVDSLWDNGTWELVDLPPGKKVTGTQMLCERKRGADGEVTRHKGRFVVRGDTQQAMVDYGETWAPVARHATLRAILAKCAAERLVICQLDVETAFLHGVMEEEVYVRQPQGYERGDATKVCRLVKALYGLKQASRAWYKRLAEALMAGGLKATDADPCLFVGSVNEEVCYVLVYVDDLLLASASPGAVEATKRHTMATFKSREMGEPSYFLGMHIQRDVAAGVLRLGQRQYAMEVLARFNMANSNAARLPMPVGARLQKDGKELDTQGKARYQELVGCLLYLATCTRPDISFAVGRLARFVSAPTQAHWGAGKAVLRYLQGTKDLGIEYGKASELTAYHDADYAADVDTRRSTTGAVFLFNGGAISWTSKQQKSVATSTTEAEYMAASMAAKEAVWLQRLLGELGNEQASVEMRCDSQGAVAMMRNPVSSPRTKHIDVAFHFVREMVEVGNLTVCNVSTSDMRADVLIKALPINGHVKCREDMGLVKMTTDSASARVGVSDGTPARDGGKGNGPAAASAPGAPPGANGDVDARPPTNT